MNKGLVWLRRLQNALLARPDGQRIFGLDLMRAAAIMFVLVLHGNNLHNNKTLNTVTSWIGFDGVSVFFVLSGFLIGGILLKTLDKGDRSFQALLGFWKRRWLRTIPTYYLVLITLIGLSVAFQHIPMFQYTKKFFVFLQNFSTPHPNFFPEAWSLAVEEWFYLLMPSGVFIVASIFQIRNKQAVLSVTLALLVFSLCFRCYRYSHLTVTDFAGFDKYYRKLVLTRLDSIAFGVLGAFFARYQKEHWLRYKQILLVAGLSFFLGLKLHAQLATPSFGFYTCVLLPSIETFAALLFLPFLSQWKEASGWLSRIVTHISLISYSLYLLNYTVVQGWILPEKNTHSMDDRLFVGVRYAGFWVVTFLLSTLLYNLVERPVMRLRK